MKKLVLLIAMFSSSIYAAIPYCSGTGVEGSKHHALQYVVSTYALANHCTIGNNCILNFDSNKYSIAWADYCKNSALKGNDRKGSTFICSNGECHPLGFTYPSASY